MRRIVIHKVLCLFEFLFVLKSFNISLSSIYYCIIDSFKVSSHTFDQDEGEMEVISFYNIFIPFCLLKLTYGSTDIVPLSSCNEIYRNTRYFHHFKFCRKVRFLPSFQGISPSKKRIRFRQNRKR